MLNYFCVPGGQEQLTQLTKNLATHDLKSTQEKIFMFYSTAGCYTEWPDANLQTFPLVDAT